MKTLSTISRSSLQTQQIVLMKRVVMNLATHWLFVINIVIGIWVLLPWLAPVFMRLGWNHLANAIYLFYSFQCHQLPQRSFFLFGTQTMYSLTELQAAGVDTANPVLSRQFIGNVEMGWKVAWSDRMVGMYTSIWLANQLYGLIKKRIKPISVLTFALLSLPMVIDGTTHLFSDFAGIGKGFRDSNIWLQILTNNILPQTFYQGDALGSFNSWMRLLTGALFGLGFVWFAYPYINESLNDVAQRAKETLNQREIA
jgi:uncharacterized membrane protein